MNIKLDSPAILNERGPKNQVVPNRPYHFLKEKECGSSGKVEDIATIFLTNKECPFRCLMCDLWKNTTDVSVDPTDILEQIEFALAGLANQGADVNQISTWKLYNSGNFFDKKAIPVDAVAQIGDLANQYSELGSLNRLIVECHPKMVGDTCLSFSKTTQAKLEVAMGLETTHPDILPRLNKSMTLDDFRRSTELLLQNQIDVRAFILLRTPWMTEDEGIEWAIRSAEWAFKIGVQCCAVIPTRRGNGILDRLEQQQQFAEPTLRSMEFVQMQGLKLAGNHQRFLSMIGMPIVSPIVPIVWNDA